MSGQRIEAIRNRTKRSKSTRRRERRLRILGKVEKMRSAGGFDTYSAVDYEEAREIISPLKDDPKPEQTPDPAEGNDNGFSNDTLDGSGVSAGGGEALLDGDDQALQIITDSVTQALDDAIEDNEDVACGEYSTNGTEQRFEFQNRP